MTSFWVVKHLDIVKNLRSGFLPGNKYFLPDTFPLQSFKKALCNGIVIAVTPSTHAGDDVVLSEQTLPFIGAELRSLIGMEQY